MQVVTIATTKDEIWNSIVQKFRLQNICKLFYKSDETIAVNVYRCRSHPLTTYCSQKTVTEYYDTITFSSVVGVKSIRITVNNGILSETSEFKDSNRSDYCSKHVICIIDKCGHIFKDSVGDVLGYFTLQNNITRNDLHKQNIYQLGIEFVKDF